MKQHLNHFASLTARSVLIGSGTAMCLLGAAVIVSIGADFQWTLWADRDFLRSKELIEHFQVTGAEFLQGPRTPGGFYYYYIFAFSTFFESFAHGAAYLLALSYLVGTLAIWRGLQMFVTPSIAIFCAGVVSSFTIIGITFIQLWNPSYSFVFACMGLYFMLRFITKNDFIHFLFMNAVLFFGLQIHFSMIYLVLLFNFCAIWLGNEGIIKYTIGILLVFAAAFFPFFLFLALGDMSILDMYREGAEYEHFQGVFLNSEPKPLLRNFLNYFHISLGFESTWPTRLFSAPPTTVAEFSAFGRDISRSATTLLVIFFCFSLTMKLSKILIGRFINRNVSDSLGQHEKIAIAMIAFVVLVCVQHTFMLENFDQRRLVWSVPIIIFLLALSIQYLMGEERYPHTKLPVLRFVSVILISTTTLAYSSSRVISNWGDWIPEKLTLMDVEEVSRVFVDELNFDEVDLRTRVLINVLRPENMRQKFASFWYPASYYAGSEFFIRQNTQSKTGSANAALNHIAEKPGTVWCGLAFARDNQTRSRPATQDIENAFLQAGLNPRIVSWKLVRETTRFMYVHLLRDGHNCLRNLHDVYFPNPEESKLEQFLDSSTNQNQSTEIKSIELNENVRKNDVIFELGNTIKKGAMLALDYSSQGLSATMYSRSLRGWDGTRSYEIKVPTLVLTSLENNSVPIRIEIHHGTLGGPNTSTRGMPVTPWRSDVVAVPRGTYSLSFEAAAYREYAQNNWHDSVSIILNTHLTLNK